MTRIVGHTLLADARQRASARDASRIRAYVTTLINGLTTVQRSFVLDTSRDIAALCPRRAGKTTAARARLVRRALTQRNANCLYLAMTRQHAEELIWGELKRLDQELALGAQFNNTALRMTLPHLGSEITLSGADNRADIDKHRGQKYDEVIVDEAASFPAKLLDELLGQVIGPALMDRRGTLGLIGTPKGILQGPFYEATRPGSPIARPWKDRDAEQYRAGGWRWSVHQWGLRDNNATPETRAMWATALEDKQKNGWSDENPIWRREYLGEWVADDADRVYKFREYDDAGELWNVWDPGPKTQENPFGLPEGHWWRYVYGIDLGSKDPFALQVIAYADTSPTIYQAYEFSRRGMSVSEVGELLSSLIEKTGYPDGMVADLAGNGGMIISELNTRFGLAIEAAEKKNKPDSIELTNSELVEGRLKLIRGSLTTQQMADLQWDETGMRENKAQRNDQCDALIYTIRKVQRAEAAAAPTIDPARAALPPDARKQADDEDEWLARASKRGGRGYDWAPPNDV